MYSGAADIHIFAVEIRHSRAMCEHLIFLWPLIIFFAQFGEKNIEILCGHVAEHDRWLIHIWVRDALVVLRRLSAMAVVPDYLLKRFCALVCRCKTRPTFYRQNVGGIHCELWYGIQM